MFNFKYITLIYHHITVHLCVQYQVCVSKIFLQDFYSFTLNIIFIRIYLQYSDISIY